MNQKRTQLNFSKHELFIKTNDDVTIHHLKVPGTRMDSIEFINVSGIMAMTGDYGNWMFCREFHPSSKDYVSDHYWIEKLKLSSCQNPYRYDSEGTAKEIQELLNDKENPPTKEEKEYLKECLRETDDEVSYVYQAYRNNVGGYEDGECVPFVQKLHPQLPFIFDAFDEICRRLKEKEAELAKENQTTEL